MSRNGERRQRRPRIELLTAMASESEAAAIVTAVEQFLADTAPVAAPLQPTPSAWQRAALREGVSRSADLAWGPDSR
jgi:hypothetical protein